MGCGATKSQANNVVEGGNNKPISSPEKSPPSQNDSLQHTKSNNSTPPPSNPQNSSPSPPTTDRPVTDVPSTPTPVLPIPNPTPSPRTPPPSSPTHRGGEIIDVDVLPKVPTPAKSAVKDRLEKYAEEKKITSELIRPSTANIERRLADAEERRKAQSEQKLKKVKLKHKDIEERGAQLKELEEKKAQELMQLIKSKSVQANQKRQAIHQEVKAKAEEETAKAREAASKKSNSASTSASQTPLATPHRMDESEDSKLSILETPLPPLSNGTH